MRVLFVGMARSVHTAGWVRQLHGLGWDLHFFPADLPPPHPALRGVTFHWDRYRLDDWTDPERRDAALARVVRAVRPDVVHALSVPEGAWPALDARRHLDGALPPLLLGIWGGCLYFYGRLRSTEGRVREALAAADALLVEGERDVRLARELGYAGPVAGILPAPGGMDSARHLPRAAGPPSARRVVAVNGQQGWTGRAHAAVAACGMCARELTGYTVVLHSVSDFGVEAAAELRLSRQGVRVETLGGVGHDEFMALLGRSRVSLQAKVCDGLNQTFAESMLMGAFPVLADHGIQGEWAADGRTALFVDPDDASDIARALRRALADDALVDAAAEANRRRAVEHMDEAVIRPKAIAVYERLADGTLAAGAVGETAQPRAADARASDGGGGDRAWQASRR